MVEVVIAVIAGVVVILVIPVSHLAFVGCDGYGGEATTYYYH